MNGEVADAHALCRNKWSRCQAKELSRLAKNVETRKAQSA